MTSRSHDTLSTCEYPRLVAGVRTCMSRVLKFHAQCLARGWHVHVGGEF